MQDNNVSPKLLIGVFLILGIVWYFDQKPKPEPVDPDDPAIVLTEEELVAVKFIAQYADRMAVAFNTAQLLIPESDGTDDDVTNFHTDLSVASKTARESSAASTVDIALEDANQKSSTDVKQTENDLSVGFRESASTLRKLFKD